MGVKHAFGLDPEVKDPARMTLKPSQHFWMFMGGIIVDNGMDDFSGRNLGFDGVQEADEFLVAMALHVATDHGPVENVQGGEERGGAVALVIMGHGSAAALPHRQSGLAAVQSLDLTLLVDGKHERVRGRRHVKPDDVLKLFNEFWVIRQFELPEPVRLKPVRAPNPLDRAHRDARSLSHG